MNKFTALDRVNALYSVINTDPISIINNTKLSSSILIYIKKSGVVLKINDNPNILPHKDSVFYINKDTEVTVQAKKNSSYDIYYFTSSEVKRVFNILSTLIINTTENTAKENCKHHNYDENYLCLESRDGDHSIFRMLHEDITPLRKTHILLYFLSSHPTLSLFYFFRKNIKFTFSESIRLIIEDDLSAPWTISDISKMMYTSESTARKKLSKENQTFSKILLEVRMHAAAKMILTTEKSINIVAQSVGYTSSSYFIKSFKNFFKITPKQLSLKIKRESIEK